MTRLAARHPWLMALASAALLSVAGRPWGLGHLVWVAFVPLFAALAVARSWQQAAALAFVSALGVAALAYEAAAALGPFWLLFAVAVGALPFAAAGAGAWLVARRLPAALCYLTPALFWVVAELLPAQPWLLGRYALPLTTIGYTQAELPAMHLARFGSVTATSLALLVGNALVAQLLAGRGQHRFVPIMGLACLALTVVAAWRTAPVVAAHARAVPSLEAASSEAEPFGAQRTSAPQGAATGVDLAVIQPNRATAVLAAALRSPAVRDGVVAELAAQAAQPPVGGELLGAPQLLVFPEGAWPHPLNVQAPGDGLPAAATAALATLPPAIIGAAGRTENGQPTNSAYYWNGVELTHAYAKVHLVPVTEAGLVPGAAPTTVALPTPSGEPLLVAPFICYDIVFPGTVRAAVSSGAELLAVLTDDAFAAKSGVPHQHLRLARFRAVENGVPLAFASNTGPSALVAADGSTVAATVRGEAAAARAWLGTGTGSTPYARYGNWVGALTCLLVALMAAWAALSAAGWKGGVPIASPPVVLKPPHPKETP